MLKLQSLEDNRALRRGLWIAYAALLLVLTGPPEFGWNENSRLATVESLVERGTLSIGESTLETGDKCWFRGVYYSDKPPIPSLIGAVAYWPVHRILGLRLAEDPLAYRLVTFFAVGLAQCLLVAVFYRAIRSKCRFPLAMTAILALATLLPGYATVYNNHAPGALFLFGALAAVSTRFGNPPTGRFRWTFVAGFCAGLSVGSDLSTAVYFALFGLLLFLWERENLEGYVWGALIPIGLFLLVNVRVTGDILPAYFHPEGYDFPGSHMAQTLGGSAPSALPEVMRYLFECTFGVPGFFTNTPVLLLGLVGVAVAMRRPTDRGPALCVLAGFAVSLAFYGLRSSNFGGYSFGFRYLLPATPLLLYYLPDFLDPQRRVDDVGARPPACSPAPYLRGVVLVLFLIPSLGMSALCVMEPWQPTGKAIADTVDRVAPGLGDSLRGFYHSAVGRNGTGEGG